MVAYTFKQKGITNMSRNLTKSILSRDEISLLLNSEETKNKSLYGNLFDVLNAIKNMKAVTIWAIVVFKCFCFPLLYI